VYGAAMRVSNVTCADPGRRRCAKVEDVVSALFRVAI